MTRGGDRKRAGRTPVPESEKKKMYAVKLRPDQLEWLRSQYKASQIIERLIDDEMERMRQS